MYEAFKTYNFINLYNFCQWLQKKDTATPKPTADFSYSFVTSGMLPTVVQFTSKSQNADNYFWDFGDSSTSSSQNPEHTYNTIRTYLVKLVVSNSSGKDSVNRKATVTLHKPKTNFTVAIQTLLFCLKQYNIWFIIQIAMAAFLIIIGCLAPDKPYENDKITLNKIQGPFLIQALKPFHSQKFLSIKSPNNFLKKNFHHTENLKS